ncbi:MAG: YidC/Oxa1 family membrane protein insertase, partial [Defluviitaleaceae bacterium]|nr:YidC/Oxa1 family membrane protein insertase [Defluviitaleaceae bacterium]
LYAFLLQSTLQNEPNILVRPIAVFLGWILNFIYDIVYMMSPQLAFGISIILFTIVVRALMIPLAIKQQKSMAGMSKLAPEMEKIKKKYGDSKDPAQKQKMTAETQALYSKAGVNPLGGCLPLLVQFPIFIALFYIMQQSYLFIEKMGEVYRQIGALAMQVTPDWVNPLRPIAAYKIAPGREFDIGILSNLQKLFYSFTPDEWTSYLANIPSDIAAQMTPLVEQAAYERTLTWFVGIDLLAQPSLASVSILIPLLCAITTFLQSWLMNKATVATSDAMKMQQRMMLIMMPIMMGWFTFTFPAGVGLYWLSSTVFHIFQQLVLNKKYLHKADAAAKPA